VLCSSVQQFVGASMGTSNLKIPSKNSNGEEETLPSRACCVIVEFIAGGTLKQYLIKNRKKKLAYKVVVQLALDLARGYVLLDHLYSNKTYILLKQIHCFPKNAVFIIYTRRKLFTEMLNQRICY